MKIDLLKFVEDNKKIKNDEKELNFRKELKELIKDIMDGNEYFVTDNDLFINEVHLKAARRKKGEQFKKDNKHLYWFTPTNYKYKINLTKANIKLVQEYINKEETSE